MKERILTLINSHNTVVKALEDSIENQGAHLYFVFRCGQTWREQHE